MDCVVEDINDDSYDEEGNRTEEEHDGHMRSDLEDDPSSQVYMTFSPGINEESLSLSG